MTSDLYWQLFDESIENDFIITTYILLPSCDTNFGCDPSTLELAGDGETPEELAILEFETVNCPSPWVDFDPIRIGSDGQGDGGKIAPDYPVVVGQDDERRGVDVQAWAQVPPVYFHWYEAVPRLANRCLYTASAWEGERCTDANTNVAARIGNPNWQVRQVVTYDCREHVEVYPDPIANVNVSLVLADKSRRYINGHLAVVYPGARVYQPAFSLNFPGPGGLSGSTYFWETTEEKIQIQDPGWWVVTVTVTTTGTEVSAPRTGVLGLGGFWDFVIRVKLDQ